MLLSRLPSKDDIQQIKTNRESIQRVNDKLDDINKKISRVENYENKLEMTNERLDALMTKVELLEMKEYDIECGKIHPILDTLTSQEISRDAEPDGATLTEVNLNENEKQKVKGSLGEYSSTKKTHSCQKKFRNMNGDDDNIEETRTEAISLTNESNDDSNNTNQAQNEYLEWERIEDVSVTNPWIEVGHKNKPKAQHKMITRLNKRIAEGSPNGSPQRSYKGKKKTIKTL